jgi:hypothetical protein
VIPAPPPEAIHLSFEPGPYRMAMGLIALPETEMIELDDRYADEMAQRRVLLTEQHHEVFHAVAGSEAARQAVLDRLAEYLPERFPAWVAREDSRLHNRLTGETWDLAALTADPLVVAAQLVQEDLCIVEPDADGAVLLTAGVVCFPSRWRLAEKIGRPLPDVHERVPFYGDKLARPVDRFMAMIKPGKLAMRLNWSMMDDPALFQLGGKFRDGTNAAITQDNAGDRLFVRVERQTLSRLPYSAAVLFTIRVHVYPLGRIVAQADIAARLADAVRALPPETSYYKSLPTFQAALLGYLDRRAAGSVATV